MFKLFQRLCSGDQLAYMAYTWLGVFVCESMCLSVSLSVCYLFHLHISWRHRDTLMKRIMITHHLVHVTLMTCSRSWSQTSRSGSDDHRHIVNELSSSWTTEGIWTKTYRNISYSQDTNCLGFWKSWVQRSRSQKRFPAEVYGWGQRFAVEYHLVFLVTFKIFF